MHISVRELVQYIHRSGDLESTFFGISNSVDGIRAHQKIQNSRPDLYESEVYVSHTIQANNYELQINGRIDGVFNFQDHVIIEEIKSTTRNINDFEEKKSNLHWGQAKCYSYIYAVQNSLENVETQLTYYHLETGEIREFKESYTLNDLESFFNELVTEYLEWADLVVIWQMERDISVKKLLFPYASYRKGQREMAVDVYLAVKNKTQLIVQAPTGIGKTMAAVFPSVKALAEGATNKIFYLTARTTGRNAAEKAFEELNKTGLKIKTITLTAKKKICFNHEVTCNGDECEYAKGYYDRIGHTLKDTFSTDIFSREIIEKMSRKYRVCPFELSLDLSIWADCIICDYNYAFDPKVYLRRFFEETGDYTFLVDEAHNLVDRSREMFSAKLYKQVFLDQRRLLKKELPEIFKCMGKINTWFLKALKRIETTGAPVSEKDEPVTLYPHLRKFVKAAERWLSLNIKTPFREELLELYFEVTGFLKISEQYDSGYATCFEKKDNDLEVKLFCIDPSEHLEKALKRSSSTVFFSATMTPTHYFKKIFGCTESSYELILPSPFPKENLCLVVSDRISTLYKEREKTKSQVTNVISSLVTSGKGNYLIFFPSYKYMMMIFELFSKTCPDIEAIIQSPEMTENDRQVFIEQFTTDNTRTLAGFAVMGGIFGEGIDLVGDRLTGAVIVGVGLPGISLERDLIRDHFTDNYKSGFEYAYLYPGINRVLQATGRVIRTEKDRGIVVLIDERYSTLKYKSLMPEEWNQMFVRNKNELETALKKFRQDK
ncbi:MAG: ATP-dependent DNA helicase [Desulfobacterales bacterium]|nr:ATP-dependent DNA helicase [Desulfobacterales bacterium]